MKRPTIAIVGSGRLGSALALQLHAAGYDVSEIASRNHAKSLGSAKRLAQKIGAHAAQLRTAKLSADLIWVCVPDSQIAPLSNELSRKSWGGQFAFHSSGVLSSDVLTPLRKKGARIASVHPLMTFIDRSLPNLTGVSFAIEGNPSALRVAAAIAKDLGGIPRRIRKQAKPAYHAFATMICPLLVALLTTAEEAARAAEIPSQQARKRMLPIVQQTIANYVKLGPARAFTGPIVRGDAETIQLHLKALAGTPVAGNTYAALAQAALELLPCKNEEELKKLLGRFSLRSQR